MRQPLLVTAAAASAVLAGALLAAPASADSISWQTTSQLSEYLAQSDPGEAVALSDGSLVAVWSQSGSVGGAETPFAGVHSATGTSKSILDAAASTAAQPVVAASDDGTVRVAIWKSMSGSTRVLRWSRWNGSGWTSAATLLNNVHETIEADLHLSHDGKFGVLTAASTGGSLFAFRFDGSGFAAADTLASAGSLSHPVVAVSGGSARAVVAWVQTPPGGGSTTQLYSRYWSGSSWGTPLNASQSPAGRSVAQGTVGISADGDKTLAAWRAQQSGSWSASAATGSAQAWDSPAALTTQPYTNIDSLNLALSADASNAQVAFSARTSAVGDNVFVMSTARSGGVWSGPSLRAGPMRTEAEPHPSLALSRDGSRGLLVYQLWDSSNNKNLRSLRYADGAWDSPNGGSLGPINSNDRSGVGTAALDRTGTLGGAVWRQRSGGQESVNGKRLIIRTAPTAPRSVTAEAVSETAARITWSGSDFDGNWSLPEYTARSESGEGLSCSTITTACLVTGLRPGATYRFFVSAGNYEGTTQSELSAAVTMPGGTPPAGGTGPALPSPTTPPAPTVVLPERSQAPGAVAGVRIKSGKKAGKSKRRIVVRWSDATGATGYRIRVSKPGGTRWGAWTAQRSKSKRFRLVVGKRYRIAVQATAGTAAGTATVKKFRVKR